MNKEQLYSIFIASILLFTPLLTNASETILFLNNGNGAVAVYGSGWRIDPNPSADYPFKNTTSGKISKITVKLNVQAWAKEQYPNGYVYMLGLCQGRTNGAHRSFYSTHGYTYSQLPSNSFEEFTFYFTDSCNLEHEVLINVAVQEGLLNVLGYVNWLHSDIDLLPNARIITLGEKDPWIKIEADETNPKKTPVIFVPGVLGTEISKSNNLLWADILRMNLPFDSDDFMDPLVFNTDLKPQDHNLQLLNVITKKSIAGLFEYNYLDNLQNIFENQGYIENSTFFTFPYDWRYGVSGVIENPNGTTSNTELLKEKIQGILEQTGADKVHVIAHSTGGLLVKKYVSDNENSHKIDKAIFLGVPNTGAPKAIKALAQGDNFGILGLSDEQMEKISKNLPVVYDLAPSEKYYATKGSYFKQITGGTYGFSHTLKELNFDEVNEFLTNQEEGNPAAIQKAKALHGAIDDYDMRGAGVDLYNIVGCKNMGTIGTVIQKSETNILGQTVVKYNSPKLTLGDGTVPLESATHVPVNQANKFYALKGGHGTMPSQNGIRQQIANILTGANLPVDPSVITQDINKCQLKGKAVEIYSPVDIEVIDQLGNRLGLAADKSLENNIENAGFHIFGDQKFVFLPTDEGQTYEIKLKGTGDGNFTLKIKDIADEEVTKSEVFSNLPVTTRLKGKIILGTETNLALDNDDDGIFEQILTPQATLAQSESEDLLPPTSTATISGTGNENEFYRSDVKINITAQDEPGNPVSSGVLALNYKINSGPWTSTTSTSSLLSLSSEGVYTILFFATDKAGNSEPKREVTFTIDKTPPEISLRFDPLVHDLMFSAFDNISTGTKISLVDQDNKITAKDEAGNTTQIMLKDKNRKKSSKAEITSLLYNGLSADISKNKLVLQWDKSQNNQVGKLVQKAKSKKDYFIEAEYKNNQTKLSGRDEKTKISKTLPGLIIINVSTNKGDFEWNYATYE